MSIESFREKRKCLGRSFQIRPTRPVHATRCRPVHPSVARASKKGSRSGIIFQRTFWRHFRLGFVFVRLRRRDRVFCFFFFGNSGDSTCRPELINISLVCSWHWGLLDPVVANCGFVPCMPCTNNASRETVPFETDSFYWKPDIFTRISRFSKGVSSRFSFLRHSFWITFRTSSSNCSRITSRNPSMDYSESFCRKCERRFSKAFHRITSRNSSNNYGIMFPWVIAVIK